MELRPVIDLEVLLDQTDMTRSSYCYHEKMNKLTDKYDSIKKSIKKTYEHHKGRYGYRRIAFELKKIGIIINHKKMLLLMKQLDHKSLIRVKKYKPYKGQEGKIAGILLNSNLNTVHPDQKWATDVTEFNVLGRKLYLSPVIDLFNGEIISYELSERLKLC